MRSVPLLQGTRVLDFTWVAAGPSGTLLLAMAGADVIKVESRARLDNYRKSFGLDGDIDRSMLFAGVNVGKRSITVDAKSAEGRELLLDLAARVDVVTENFSPGVMNRLGLGYEHIRERNERIVYVSSSAAGQTGPKSGYSGFASIFAAQGGLAGITRRADGSLAQFGRSIDSRVGTVIAIAAVLGLRLRDRTGHGQHLDVSGQEVVAALIGDVIHGVSPPERSGQTFQCADGWIYVDGSAALDGDSRATIADTCRARRSADALDALQSVGVDAIVVPRLTELVPAVDGPLTGPWDETHHRLMGRVVSVGSPIEWPPTLQPTPEMRPAPLLGEHTEEVLAEILAADAPSVKSARDAQVLQ